MGGATRFMTLLTTPFPPLRPSLHLLRRRISTTHLRPITLSRPSKINTHAPQLVSCFHSQPNNTNTNTFALNSAASQQQQHHPWPEWTNFLNMVSNAPADNKVLQEDAFVVYEQLPDHFVLAAASCLAFARARPNLLGSLSRRDIEAVVSNGTPFLFKSAMDTARRMRAFLASDVSSASEVDVANTVDLMKYILSYASNPTVSFESNGLYSRELIDSSVRNLLHELVTVICGAPLSSVPAFDDQFSGRPRQTFRPLGRHVEMKRGDWICTKCNFMNFAKNMSCLECEEPRPRKQLTGGEWECSQCNFFNYGGNSVCLRCDCRRPGAPLFHSMNSNSGSGYNRDNPYMGKQNVGMKVSPSLSQTGSSDFQYPQGSNSTRVPFAPLPTNTLYWGDQTSEMNDGKGISSSESQNLGANIQFTKDSTTQTDKDKEQAGKTQNWFKKIAELHNVKDLPNAVSDEDFPEIMPMRKGENRFVVSKKKDRSLTSPKYKRQVAMEETNSTSFPTFVPFPPGYFAKKDTEQPSVPDSPVKAEPTGSDESNDGLNTNSGPRVNYQTSSTHNININSQAERFSGKESAFDNSNSGALSQLPENESFRSSWAGPSLEGSAVKETDPLDMSEEAKAERWFKRVAQIKDISELSQIPDEDFPSIMPMRKGVNRFVVSKRKTPLERRLTNQQYRRNLPIVTTDPYKKESDNN